MERDLNGQLILDASEAASRRAALEMAAIVERALADGTATKRRIEAVNIIHHKPSCGWTRKDGMTGQRKTWQRQLSGHKASRKRANEKAAASITSPKP